MFGLVEGGVARAYPQRVLVWHEIVNDVIGDVGRNLLSPFAVWLLSPVNLATGTLPGLLTGLQVALVAIARRCSVACGLSPAAGVHRAAGLVGR